MASASFRWRGSVAAIALFCLLPACGQQPSPVAPAANLSPATAKSEPDTFLLHAPGADAVYLAGSMNDWVPNDPAYALTPLGDGVGWRLITELPAGLNAYKYILRSGPVQEWITDPVAVEVSPDGFHGNPGYWNAVRGREVTRPAPLPEPPDRRHLVIYELSVNDFSLPGTWTGVTAGLTSGPNLVELGVNAIELMPVTAPSSNGWGYDPVLYHAPNPSFGWTSNFAELVDAAHGHGIAIILDAVLNHSAGSSVLRQLDDFADAFNFTTDEPNPWGLVELNWENPLLREHVLASLCLWVERYRVDGFRLDYIGGEPYSTWVWLKDELRARYPDLLLIAEDFNYAGAEGNAVTHGFDAQWGGNHTDGWGGGGNNFGQVMLTVLTENGFAWRGQTTPSVGAFGTAYRNMWAAANVIAGNSQYGGAVPGDGFSDVKYLESHDENRLVWSVDTFGSPGAQALGGLAKARLGALVQMTCVGIPMLYNGQEIGSAEYRPAFPTIFKIDWDSGDQELRDIYRHLIQLRLSRPALASEEIFFQWRDGIIDQEERTLVYWRGGTGAENAATVVIALNFDHQDHAWSIPFPAPGHWLRLTPETGAWQNVQIPAEGLLTNVPASTGALWLKADGITGVPY